MPAPDSSTGFLCSIRSRSGGDLGTSHPHVDLFPSSRHPQLRVRSIPRAPRQWRFLLLSLLSAFVLYRPFVEARVAGTDRTRFSDYGRRRFVRIAPAFWAVLTITAVVPGMAGAFSANWWVYYGLLQSFPVYKATGTCAVDVFHCRVPVAWTLTLEVLFYMTLPLFVLAMAWLGKRWRDGWLMPELVAAALISAISIVIQSSIPTSDLHIWLSTRRSGGVGGSGSASCLPRSRYTWATERANPRSSAGCAAILACLSWRRSSFTLSPRPRSSSRVRS